MTGRHWGYSPLGRGRINGHARNRENRRHQHRENQSAHLTMIGALSLASIYSCYSCNRCVIFQAKRVAETLTAAIAGQLRFRQVFVCAFLKFTSLAAVS